MKPIFAYIILIICTSLISSIFISSTDENISEKILSSFKDGSKKQLFKVYHFLFQKQYDLNSEEGVRRYKNFKQMVKYIDETNSKDLSHKAGINQFTDMTNEEFKKWISSQYIPNDEMNFSVPEHKSSAFLPEQTKIDWKGYFSPVTDQGDCGSCWAFSAAYALEGNYNLKYNQTMIFSPQDLVDCDTIDKGCNGGASKTSFNWIAKNGISLLNDYPYSGLQGTTCNAINKQYLIEGVDSCLSGSCTRDGVLTRLAKGPLSSTIDASSIILQTYQSGVIDPDCFTRNHGITIVGYDPVGLYYEVRNSWGPTWGENGYFRTKINDSNQSCFLEQQAHRPVIYPITPDTPKSCIDLYPNCGFDGTPYEVCESQGTLSGFNGIVNSFSNKFQETVYFYSGGNCSGTTYIFTSDNSCFTNSAVYKNMVNNIKSVSFPNRDLPSVGCIKVYDASCYAGNVAELCDSVSDLSKINWSNKISSINISTTGITSITIYTGLNFTGSSTTITTGRPSMTTTFVNKIFSIKFTK